MLNPMQNYTYDVMKEIFKETKETFPDEYLHLGMDEVYYKCWWVNLEISILCFSFKQSFQCFFFAF